MSKGSARRKQQVSDEQLGKSWETIFGSKHGRNSSSTETYSGLPDIEGNESALTGGNRSDEADAQSSSHTSDCRDTSAPSDGRGAS